MNNKILIILGVIVLIAIITIGIKSLYAPISNELIQESSKPIGSDKENQTPTSSGAYMLNNSKSEIEWEGRKIVLKNWIDIGTVSLKSGSLTLDNGKINSGEVTVDMNTIAAKSTGAGGGQDRLSKHLKSEDFFNVLKYPTAKFTFTSVTPLAEKNMYKVVGDITIKDIIKSIEFTANIYEQDSELHLQADLILDRSQFDIRFGSPSFFTNLGDNAIDNNFTLRLSLVADKSI